MKIEILTERFVDSVELYENIARVAMELKIDADITTVKNPARAKELNVTRFPAIIIDGQVQAQGVQLSPERIRKLLT